MKLSFLLALGLSRLAANCSAWAQTPIPFSTQSPSGVVAETQPSTSCDQNTVRIHWCKGNRTYFIAFGRTMDEFSGNPIPAMVEPDDRPYPTMGDFLMNAASLVPNNPYYPAYPRSDTYLLRRGTFGSPSDTTAQLNAAAVGHEYEVKVFEYNTDPRGNFYVSAPPMEVTQSRSLPRITSIRRNAQDQPGRCSRPRA
jgi:hypothetical protein